MKAVIVTFVRAYNYGAVLQCYALQKKLHDIGIDADVLDYYPPYFFDKYNANIQVKKALIPYKPLKKWIRNTITSLLKKRRAQQFEQFIRDNISLSSKQYNDAERLSGAELPYDTFIVGSDQVWNSSINRLDPVYFLDFKCPERHLKLSYSASFGFETIPVELIEKYRKWLSGWDAYSVRESSGASIIQNLLGKEAVVCCDPTLLLERAEWAALCKNKRKKESYVLGYYVNTAEIMSLEEAKKIAVERGVGFLCMTSITSFRDISGIRVRAAGGKMMALASPIDFVTMINNAECVVTDSYHGMIFSLLFHKRVFLKLYNSEGKPNERMMELINQLELDCSEERNGFFDICKGIDWIRLDRLLSLYRKQSIDYLMRFTEFEKNH